MTGLSFTNVNTVKANELGGQKNEEKIKGHLILCIQATNLFTPISFFIFPWLYLHHFTFLLFSFSLLQSLNCLPSFTNSTCSIPSFSCPPPSPSVDMNNLPFILLSVVLKWTWAVLQCPPPSLPQGTLFSYCIYIIHFTFYNMQLLLIISASEHRKKYTAQQTKNTSRAECYNTNVTHAVHFFFKADTSIDTMSEQI